MLHVLHAETKPRSPPMPDADAPAQATAGQHFAAAFEHLSHRAAERVAFSDQRRPEC